MRSRWMIGGLLLGTVYLATGACVDAVQEARHMQHTADIAMAFEEFDQPMIAYRFYEKVAYAFPDTAYGRLAAKRARHVGRMLRRPARSPDSESFCSGVGEFFDWVTWP